MTLKRLLNDPEALEALMNVEGFRTLNKDLEKIINNSHKIKNIKKNKEIDSKVKKQLTELEKEQKSLRKQVQESVQKLSTRVPIFMYLTDFREQTLKDVITQLEPDLFKKVTGLTTKMFEKLINIGLFQSSLMNSAVGAFKRYENASLHYAGGFSRFEKKEIGLWDTKISHKEFTST